MNPCSVFELSVSGRFWKDGPCNVFEVMEPEIALGQDGRIKI